MMNRSWIVGLGCLFCGLFEVAHSQSPEFQPFEEGLFSENIKVAAFAQNSDHELFIATQKNGIFIYDGIMLRSIPAPDSILKKTPSAMTFHGGQLWVGTVSGELITYDGEEFSNYKNERFHPTSRVSTLKSFDNSLGVATYGSGAFLIADDGDIQQFNTENGLGDDYTYDLVYRNNRLWVATDAGITFFDTQTESIEIVSMRNGLPDNIVLSLAFLNDSTLALGTYEKGVCFFHINSRSISYPNGSESWLHGPVNELVLDPSGKLWVGTKTQGIIWIDQFNDNEYMLRSLSQINGLESNRMVCLFNDIEHNMWVGTDKGVSIYTRPEIEYLAGNEDLGNVNVFDVLSLNINDYLFATDEGVYRFTYDDNGMGMVNRIIEPGKSPSEQIVSLHMFRDDLLLMGTYGAGLFTYDLKENSLSKYGNNEGLTNLNILDIASDSLGNVWLATLGGGIICGMMVPEGRLDFHSVVLDKSLINEYVYTLFVDQKQQLWVGTDGMGISSMDCTSEKFRTGYENLPKNVTVYSICEDNEGAVWFSTDDARLFQYKGNELIDRTMDLISSGKSIQSLRCGMNGDLLAVHSGGIEIMRAGSYRFELLKPEREGYDFVPNLNALDMDETGGWIGTESGVIKWSAQNNVHTSVAPYVSIQSISVLYEDHSISAETEFDYSQSHFVFEFKAIWLQEPEKVKYEYMLEGFDKKWSFPTSTRLATYSSLPPGKYNFMVRASSDGVNWSDPSSASYSFEILRPFWMKWWFYVLLVILLSIGVRTLIVFRTKKLLADKQALEDEVSKRTEEIRNQKEIIEHKSDEILASITYAQRIQNAILPPDGFIQSNLPESFVLYKPKDIVAGDFYWMTCVDDLVIFAAADCTGHGVPGAMVSVVCSNALNRSVRECGLSDPHDILYKTRELVIERFERQDEEEDTIKDGMDVALCVWNRKSNVLYFSGAQNPLWIVSKNSSLDSEPDSTLEMENDLWLHEYKPDKQPIGKYADIKPFTNRQIHLCKGDIIYIFTDGFADQFGGPRGKKLKYKPFKKLLTEISTNSMEEQKRLLDEYFEKWRGDHEQIDDVCVIGVRF